MSIFQKSDIGAQAAWKGFSSQTLYIAFRLLSDESEYEYYPEDVEDLVIKKDGVVISNTAQIDPMPVIMGNAKYPEAVLDLIREKGIKVVSADALTLAEQAGSAKAVNIVLLGRLAKHMDIATEKWIAAIESSVKPQFVELNKKAFELGYNS